MHGFNPEILRAVCVVWGVSAPTVHSGVFRHTRNIKTAKMAGSAKIAAYTTRRNGEETYARDGQCSRMNEKMTPRPDCHSRFQNSRKLLAIRQDGFAYGLLGRLRHEAVRSVDHIYLAAESAHTYEWAHTAW